MSASPTMSRRSDTGTFSLTVSVEVGVLGSPAAAFDILFIRCYKTWMSPYNQKTAPERLNRLNIERMDNGIVAGLWSKPSAPALGFSLPRGDRKHRARRSAGWLACERAYRHFRDR